MKINKFLFIYFTLFFINLSAVSDEEYYKFEDSEETLSDKDCAPDYSEDNLSNNDEDYNPEYNEDNLPDENLGKRKRLKKVDNDYKVNKMHENKSKRGETSRQSQLEKEKLEQIKECQKKIFGETENKRKYYLKQNVENELIKYYKNKNPEFKNDVEIFMGKRQSLQKIITDTFLHGLCVLYLYGNIKEYTLCKHFKMNNLFIKTTLHSNKIRFFDLEKDTIPQVYDDKTIEEIKTTLDEKSKVECEGRKWEINGTIKISSPKEGIKINKRILNLLREVGESILKNENENFQKLFGELSIINNDMKIFTNKFNAILYDFQRELTWDFKYKVQRTQVNDEFYKSSTEKICNLLFSRAMLEFLNSIILKYEEYPSLKINNKDKEIVEYLIKLFAENFKSLKEFFHLNLDINSLNKKEEIIKEKISKFIEDYINGKLKIIINHLVKKKLKIEN